MNWALKSLVSGVRSDLGLNSLQKLSVVNISRQRVKSSLASGDLCSLLITFVNSLDADQVRQNVGPDLGPNCLTL